MLSLLGAALGGGLMTLALAPFDYFFLAPLGLALWGLAWLKRPFKASFAFGLGLYASGAHWVWYSIFEIARTPFLLSALLEGLFIVGLALVTATLGWLLGKPRPRWFVFPAVVVLSELAKTYILTGFPWLFSGYAWLDTPWQHLGAWVGVYGLTLFSAALALVFMRPKQAWPLLALLGLAAVPAPITQPTGEPIRFRLVQGNVPADAKWQPEWREEVIERHLQASLGSDAELILWSEAAIPLVGPEADAFYGRLAEALPDTALLSGRLLEGPTDRHTRYYNALAGQGTAEGFAVKQRLVPFGEYMPLENLLRGLIGFFDLPMSTIISGQSPEPLRVGDYRPGVLICYEVAYPGLAWARGKPADFLLSISNDAWFGPTIARDQHLQMARMRALELGRPMLRGTNDGTTAHIGPDGALRGQLDNFVQAHLDGNLQPRAGLTPYAHTGPWAVILVCALLWLTTLLPNRRDTR